MPSPKARLPLLLSVTAIHFYYSKAQNIPSCADACIRAGLQLTNCPPNEVDCLCKDTDIFLFNVYDCLGSRKYCTSDGEIAQALGYAHAICATVGVMLPEDPFKEFGITTEPKTAPTAIGTTLSSGTSLTQLSLSESYTPIIITGVAYSYSTFTAPIYRMVRCADIQYKPTSINSLGKKHIWPLLPPIPDTNLLRRQANDFAPLSTVTATVFRTITIPALGYHGDTTTSLLSSTMGHPIEFSNISQCISSSSITRTITFTYLTATTLNSPYNITIQPSTTATKNKYITNTGIPNTSLASGAIGISVHASLLYLVICLCILFLK